MKRIVGAGAGLSASVGFTCSGKQFRENSADFEGKYGFHYTDAPKPVSVPGETGEPKGGDYRIKNVICG